MYQILPFIAYSALNLPAVSTLPVEIWSIILRNLDPASLLIAAKSSVQWRNICKSDPILRRRLKEQITREKQNVYLNYLNPGRTSNVNRNNTQRLFGANAMNSADLNNKNDRATRHQEIIQNYSKYFNTQLKVPDHGSNTFENVNATSSKLLTIAGPRYKRQDNLVDLSKKVFGKHRNNRKAPYHIRM